MTCSKCTKYRGISIEYWKASFRLLNESGEPTTDVIWVNTSSGQKPENVARNLVDGMFSVLSGKIYNRLKKEMSEKITEQLMKNI